MTRPASFLISFGSSTPLRSALKASVVLDGEIVALDPTGQPVGFQALQGRIHLTGVTERHLATKVSVAFIAFDILRDGPQDLTQLPFTAQARPIRTGV
jgi:ATP-dependent DNA ligase